nr:LacI family DNA-binding transcriptional regulator [Bifidobacterium pongonis]
MRDVAQEAGVSLKTASNVINDAGRMSVETRARVQEVIDRLGYRVNMSARNLNRNSTGVITLAVPKLTPPYLAELANRVIDQARSDGYLVYVVTYAGGMAGGARELLRGFNTTVSDGLILSMSEDETLNAEDLKVDYPLVAVGARDVWGVCDHVTCDDVQASREAASYLFERGSRHLAVIGSRGVYDEAKAAQATDGNAGLRLRGVIEACHDHGTRLDPNLVVDGGDWAIGCGYKAIQQLLDAGREFDGVVAFNDQLAIGVLSALAANGIDVPGQVQVIGFDNIEEAAYLQPPLTTMDPRFDAIVPTVGERMLIRIAGRDVAPELIRIPSRVIARATTR